MALIKCPECNREISDKASICPHCGFPISSKESNKEEASKQSFTVAYRGGPGSIAVITIIGLLFAILITGGIITVFSLSISLGPILVLIIFLIVLDAALYVLCLMNISFFILNSKRRRNCIEYDAEKDKLVLCTLKGEIIDINVDDYIFLKDNFMTDNMLFFTYRTKSGRARKVRLGYCSNREQIRSNIDKAR